MDKSELQSVYSGDAKGTQRNPYDHHSLLKYLADKENTTTHRKVVMDKVDDYQRHNINMSSVHVVIDGVDWQITGCYHIKGGARKLKISANGIHTEIFDDKKFDEIYYLEQRHLQEFDTEIKKVGTHKYDEGSGWYSQKQLYEVDGMRFIKV